MRLELQDTDGRSRDLDLALDRLLIAGYTGRDQDSVRAHVAELAEHGVAPPARIPSVFPGIAARVTTAGRIDVVGARTSGEAEFVLTRHDGELLVGVGSDHTDRELEAHSVVKSKQACDKPVGAHVWRAADVTDHWDDLELLATTWQDGREIAYQRGTLAAMLALDDLIAEVSRRAGPLDDNLLFGGTLPLLTGEFVYGERFRAELRDPVLGRSLVCDYEVRAMPVIDE